MITKASPEDRWRILNRNYFEFSDPSDDENSRVKRSMMSHNPVPKFKTLKVALMCPASLQKKYSQGNLQAITGGLVNYFMILANMVSPTFSRVCVVFYRKNTTHTFFPHFFHIFLEGGGIRREILRFASKYVMASQHRIDEIIFGLFILATKKEGESRWPELDT